MNKQDLLDFTNEIAIAFEAGLIKAPVHLHAGCEDELIEVFSWVKPEDWVFSTHRSMYHALLKGVPREIVKAEILAGRSMHLNFHNFCTSAIVGGNLPIALGVAMGIKRRGGDERVWVFCGDMAASGGMFMECYKYAGGFGLPIVFVVEDNGLSVNTPTTEVWGSGDMATVHILDYERTQPHQGTKKGWVEF